LPPRYLPDDEDDAAVGDVLVFQREKFIERPPIVHQYRIYQRGDANHLDKRVARVSGEVLRGLINAAHKEADLRLQNLKW
jgi:hypothetical protein